MLKQKRPVRRGVFLFFVVRFRVGVLRRRFCFGDASFIVSRMMCAPFVFKNTARACGLSFPRGWMGAGGYCSR